MRYTHENTTMKTGITRAIASVARSRGRSERRIARTSYTSTATKMAKPTERRTSTLACGVASTGTVKYTTSTSVPVAAARSPVRNKWRRSNSSKPASTIGERR